MSKPLSTAGSVIVTFLTTLVLNAGINYFSSDRGAASVSKPLSLEGRTVVVVSLENYTAEFAQGVALELPTTVPLTSVVSDSPVKLSEAGPPYPAGMRLVTIDQISPRLVTRLFVSFPRGATTELPRIANSAASGFRIRHESELESPLRNAVITALIVATAYAILSALVAAYASREIGSLREALAKIEERLKAANTRADAHDANVREVQTRLAKQRLLLLARLSDYSKELQFWRNAVAKLMMSKGGDLKNAEEVADVVTDSLKTFGTKSPMDDYEAVRVAASWLAEAEQDKRLMPASRRSMPMGSNEGRGEG